MDQQPKIPTLKDAQKPQVKIKGMGAGLTLFDRLKQFKKKDLAFILAGLGTLFMAPLAEHFMMAPENGDMSAGFRGAGSGSGGGLFGSGSSPYENGNNSIAQGGAIGGSGDIITPLNVRDPSALVMGPGGTQQPPAGSATPAVAPPAAPESKTDYRDALAGAASRAASAAVKKAPLPVPKIALGGSGGLRGLGAASGGSSSGSGSLGPINSGSLGQAGTGGGGLNLVRSNPNFRGAAGPRGNSPTGLDNTKKAGANAGDAFSRTGSALGGLNAAASEQIPTGGQGFGGGGQGGSGANDKPGGGAGAAGSKSVGESLAFIEAKERMMENMKLEFEKRKLKDPELLMYGIRNDILKASAAKIGEGLTTWAMCKTPLKMGCPPADSELSCTGGLSGMSTGNLDMCKPAGKPESAMPSAGCWMSDGPNFYHVNGKGEKDGPVCSPTGKPKGDGKKDTDTSNRTGPAMASSGGLSDACGKLKTLEPKPEPKPEPKSDAKPDTGKLVDNTERDKALAAYYKGTLGPKAKNAEYAQNHIVAGGASTCGASRPAKTATQLLNEAKANLIAAGEQSAATDAVSLIGAGADKMDVAEAEKARKARDAAVANIKDAQAQIKIARGALDMKYTVERPGRGNDASAEGDVDTAIRQVDTANAETEKAIVTLNKNIVALEEGITSLQPLVGDKADGALSDQIKLNKHLADLTAAAEKKAEYKPPIDKLSSPEAVKTQPAARDSADKLREAVNNAYTTAEAVKKATTDPEKKKAEGEAAEALKLVDPAVAKAKADVVAAQKDLKVAAGEEGKKILPIQIGSETPAATPGAVVKN